MFVANYFSWIYNALVYEPIYRLYRYGPAIKGVGFMRGAPIVEICSSLTNVEAKFWLQHQEECEALISREVNSYIVLIETAMYFAFLLWVFRYLTNCLIGHAKASSGTDRYWSSNSKKRYFTPLRRSTPVRASRSLSVTPPKK